MLLPRCSGDRQDQRAARRSQSGSFTPEISSHLSKPSEFDTVDQVLKGARPKQVFYVPGEHDVALDNGRQFLDRYGKQTKGAGCTASIIRAFSFFVGSRQCAQFSKLEAWVFSGLKTTGNGLRTI